MSNLVGKKATFLPNTSDKSGVEQSFGLEEKATGTLIYANKDHRYFRVEYIRNGVLLHECFKFSQIGKDVEIHG